MQEELIYYHPKISPSHWIVRTHSSILAISVSSSHGLTSRTSDDFAITTCLVAFFAWYAANLSSLIFFSSSVSSSSSSSSPKMSKSSSSSSALAGALAGDEVDSGTPGNDFCSSPEKDLMWRYHRAAWQY